MCPPLWPRPFAPLLACLWAVVAFWPAPADSACGLVTVKDKTVEQSAEKAFLSWDPQKKTESFVVQPRFTSTSADVGLLVATPSVPVVDALPADFFIALETFTILSRREWPLSKLKDPPRDDDDLKRPSGTRVLREANVGILKQQTIAADRADALFAWLKDHRFDYADVAETLKSLVEKKWVFTVVKLDPARLAKQKDETFRGELSPLRFTFAAEQPIYPLRLNRASVNDLLDLVLYVQAPYKVDLAGDLTYQYQWVPMLLNSRGWYPKGTFAGDDLPGKADDWLKAIQAQTPALLKKGQELGFAFTNKTRPQPNKLGRSATTLEWARRLTAGDLQVLQGTAPYGEVVLDPDEGFNVADLKDSQRKDAIFKVIQKRQEKSYRDRPGGYLTRAASAADVKRLKVLLPYVQEGQFVTKLRKTFTRAELTEDLRIVPAKWGAAEDTSEYVEVLPTSPP